LVNAGIGMCDAVGMNDLDRTRRWWIRVRGSEPRGWSAGIPSALPAHRVADWGHWRGRGLDSLLGQAYHSFSDEGCGIAQRSDAFKQASVTDRWVMHSVAALP
jgi:hypothetical protein